MTTPTACTQVQQGTDTVGIGYDIAGRRTSLTLPNTNNLTYAYNAASELTSVTYKQGTTTLGDLTYTYEAAGNQIKTGGTFARTNLPPALTSATYNANNQQTAFGTTTETYDLNGNLATSTDAGVTTTYTWNARNQLTGISRTGLTASLTYDSFGRRTGKTVNGTTTNFLYDVLNPVQEKNGGTVTANLLTGLGIDEFFTRTDSVGVRSLLPDALGSTIALGDGTGTLQTQYTYEPFGVTSQTGAASTNSYKFTGREDDGTGFYYYRARYYQPRLQRFIEEDPIEYGGGINLYAYASNNPTVFVDPSGLAACIYSITQHTLVCTSNDGSTTSSLGPGGVFSGLPGSCRNNPSCSDDRNQGPIPPGNYRMNKDDRPGHSNYWRLEPNPAVSGWKCLLGLARCGFMLHPGGVSLGCITASRNDPTAMSQYMGINNMLNRDLGNNTLSVVP